MIGTKYHNDAVTRIINYTVNTHKYSAVNIKKMRQFIDIQDKYRKYKFADIFPTLDYTMEKLCKI